MICFPQLLLGCAGTAIAELLGLSTTTIGRRQRTESTTETAGAVELLKKLLHQRVDDHQTHHAHTARHSTHDVTTLQLIP